MNTILRIGIFFLFVMLMGMTGTAVASDGIKNQGFILNQGQWPDSILARATFAFGDVILKKEGIVFFLRDESHAHTHGKGTIHGHDSMGVVNAHVYKMKFRNGSLLHPKGSDASAFHVNYIKGNDPSTRTGSLRCYKKVIVENIYPSIDLILYVTENGLKYDLFLKSAADPKKIMIDYEGVDSLSIDAQGNLQIQTSLGSITEQMPIAFLEKTNLSKEPVICQYQLADRTVRFKIKNLSRSKEEKLVIDPKLIFSTYSGSNGGGNADNWGNTATYDSIGNVYIAGIAFNYGFPVTTGAYQINFKSLVGTNFYSGIYGDPDVAIMKFGLNGQLVYATYLGGGLTELPTSTIVNKNNELYILGTTSSAGFPGAGSSFPVTSNAYDTTFNGGSDIYPLGFEETIEYAYGSDLFVARLSADGSSLLSSTFIGGTGNDGLLDLSIPLARNYGDALRSEILLDSVGDVYIASNTQSLDILDNSKPGANSYKGGARDGLIMKLKSDLSDVVWNTYFGGSGADACYSLQFGKNNSLYVTGGTTSSIAMTGLIQTAPGNIDGFVARFSADSGALVSSTYLGTSFQDQGYLIQTDQLGFVYVFGQSTGRYPIVNAPYYNNGSQQFIHKLSAQLDATIFSTEIGSSSGKIDIVPTAFLVNDCENIFIAGWGGEVNAVSPEYQGGNTNGMYTTSDAFQSSTDGSDFYLMVLKKDIQNVLYATYFGGKNIPEHVDGGTSRFDKKGIVYESVCACKEYGQDRFGNTIILPPDFPVTPNAYSSTIKSLNCNNAVFKFDLSSLKADFTADTTQLCGYGPVTFTNKSVGGTSFAWNLGDGSTSTSATSFTHTYTRPGNYTVQLIAIDQTTCIGRDTAVKIIQVHALPDAAFLADTVVVCKGDTAQINATYNIDYTYLWTPNQYLTNNTINNPKAYPPSTKLYYVTIKDQVTQCVNTDSALVMIVQAFADTDYENLTGCSGQPVVRVRNESDKEGFTYLWNFGDGATSSDAQQTTHTYSNFGDYIISVTVSNQSCGITDTVHVHLPPIKIPNLFTPNGDNHNDKYVIEGMTANWKLEVYNRWGNPIYTRQPYDQSWDGGDLSGGVYYFLITDPAGNKCKGWVEVFK